jgi:hypothetical protein
MPMKGKLTELEKNIADLVYEYESKKAQPNTIKVSNNY